MGALLFNDASSQYLETASAIISGYPLTMACWARSDDATIPQALMNINNPTNTSRIQLAFAGNVASDPVRASVVNNGQTVVGTSGINGYVANTWHHAAGVFPSNASRTVYLDGVAGAEETTAVTVTSLSRTNIGCLSISSTRTDFFSGRIAHAAIWSVTLTATEIAQLAAGELPINVQPDSLLAYWPLHGLLSPEPDWNPNPVARHDMTLGGSPTKVDGPPVWMPRWGAATCPLVEAAGGTSIPKFMHHYKQLAGAN